MGVFRLEGKTVDNDRLNRLGQESLCLGQARRSEHFWGQILTFFKATASLVTSLQSTFMGLCWDPKRPKWRVTGPPGCPESWVTRTRLLRGQRPPGHGRKERRLGPRDLFLPLFLTLLSNILNPWKFLQKRRNSFENLSCALLKQANLEKFFTNLL